MKEKTISFIGAGNMAHCIISGLLENDFQADKIWASAPIDDHLEVMKTVFGIHTTDDNALAASKADIVVLAVKPQVLQDVCASIRDSIGHKPLIISIAAGMEMSTISSWLGDELPLVRCMPNTPAQVLKGASGLVANNNVSTDQKAWANEMFSCVGIAEWLDDEELLHGVTALSGSGPAYIFLVIEAMEAAAVKQGMPKEIARRLAAQTVKGAAEMVLRSGVEPSQLKRNVMSPGGTTERAIQTLEDRELTAIFDEALNAASDRSHELAESLKG